MADVNDDRLGGVDPEHGDLGLPPRVGTLRPKSVVSVIIPTT